MGPSILRIDEPLPIRSPDVTANRPLIVYPPGVLHSREESDIQKEVSLDVCRGLLR